VSASGARCWLLVVSSLCCIGFQAQQRNEPAFRALLVLVVGSLDCLGFRRGSTTNQQPSNQQQLNGPIQHV
jgi:hypothetical protein